MKKHFLIVPIILSSFSLIASQLQFPSSYLDNTPPEIKQKLIEQGRYPLPNVNNFDREYSYLIRSIMFDPVPPKATAIAEFIDTYIDSIIGHPEEEFIEDLYFEFIKRH